jgi:DNA-binding HxlR family transcriptional regulator
MRKRYDQYCPIAHALDLVGDRWALLVIRELMHGEKRYTDLAANLSGIGTNVLAARLKELEAAGIVARRTLPPPAASRVYELTEYGQELRPAMRELALWGARSLGPPTEEDELFPGWLENALDVVLAPRAPSGRFEFRVGEEIASLVDGEARNGSIADPDVVIEGDATGVFRFLVDQTADDVTVEGDRKLVEALLAVVPQPA